VSETVITVLSGIVVIAVGLAILFWAAPRTVTVLQYPKVFTAAAAILGVVAGAATAMLTGSLGAAVSYGIVVGLLAGFVATVMWAAWVAPRLD